MWPFFGDGTWTWFPLIPLLLMLGCMAMMFFMARRGMMGMGMGGHGINTTGEMNVQNGSAEMQRMPGSMMRSCMEMMRRRMPAAPDDTGLHDAMDRWSGELEKKVFALVQEKKIGKPAEIAVSLGIPEDVARALINRLVTAGRIRVGSVESAN